MKTYYKFAITCVDGGHGWGQTGQRAEMCAEGSTQEEAIKKLKQQMAGGWNYEIIGPTNESFYIRHL